MTADPDLCTICEHLHLDHTRTTDWHCTVIDCACGAWLT